MSNLDRSNLSKKESTSRIDKGKAKALNVPSTDSDHSEQSLPLDLQSLARFGSARLKDGGLIEIEIEDAIMSHSYSEHIGWEEVNILLQKTELGASHVAIYQRYLISSIFYIFGYHQ